MKISKAAAPTFANKAAQQVYDVIMACPDNESAAMAQRAIVFDVMYRDVIKHRDFISKAMTEARDKRVVQLAKALQTISKSDSADQLEIAKAAVVLQTLSKANEWEQFKLHQAAQRRHRDVKGRFVVEHHPIDMSGGDAKDMGPINWETFRNIYGIQAKEGRDKSGYQIHNEPHNAQGKPYSWAQQRRYQLAYAQAHKAAEQYIDHPGAKIHLNYGAYQKIGHPRNLSDMIQWDSAPVSVAVSVDGDYDDPTGYDFYNTFNTMGMPGRGSQIQNAASEHWETHGLNPKRIHSLNDTMGMSLPDYYKSMGYGEEYGNQPGASLFRRLTQGSKLLRDTFPNAGPKAQAAQNTARWIGEYGPEAQRALGPSAQRISYRYRGTEKTPDDDLVRFSNAAKRRINERTGVDGKKVQVTGVNLMSELTSPRRNEQGKQTVPEFIDYWRKRLPDANLNTLQRKSGHIPPSEGVILDKDGNLVTQAVGYGDDWYLPFNLKNIKELKGGSYIRTRTFGGPTPEDIYTGLIAGADQITVVSWNGVYTVKFDDSFKGGRRYNDKAARMVARYGQLLDAVKSEQVELNTIEPSRNAELREQALRNARDQGSPEEVQFELDKLLAQEKLRPKISAERDKAIKAEVLQENAEKWGIPDGTSAEEVVQRVQDIQLARNWNKLDPENKFAANKAKWAEAERNRLTVDQLIRDGGLENDLTEKRSNELTQYKENLSPLSLNGQGYYEALRALHEQFPYYLEEPTYHRWVNPKDRRGVVVSGNRKDTGYVKPKHTRPEGALAGYYDKTINGEIGNSGHGKYTADSQYKDKQHVPGDITAQREAHEAWKQRKTQLSGTVNQATGGRLGEPKGDAMDEYNATKELYEHLKTLRDANFHGEHPAEAARNLPWKEGMKEVRDEGNAEDRALVDVLENMDESRFDNEFARNRGKLRQTLQQAVKAARHHFGPGMVDNRKVVAFEAKGASQEPEKVDEDDPADLLMKVKNDSEMDLGRDFERGSPATSSFEDMQDTYRTDKHIDALRGAFDLPALGSRDYESKVSELQAELNKRRGHAKQAAMFGDQEEMRQLTAHARGLARLHQLGKRWRELEKFEQDSPRRTVEEVVESPGRSENSMEILVWDKAMGARRPATAEEMANIRNGLTPEGEPEGGAAPKAIENPPPGFTGDQWLSLTEDQRRRFLGR